MSVYGLIEQFGVDNGELDGLTPAQCFTLGVEWEMFRRSLESSAAYNGRLDGGVTVQYAARPFMALVNERNVERLTAMVERHGRFCETRTRHDGWIELHVGTNKPSEATS